MVISVPSKSNKAPPLGQAALNAASIPEHKTSPDDCQEFCAFNATIARLPSVLAGGLRPRFLRATLLTCASPVPGNERSRALVALYARHS